MTIKNNSSVFTNVGPNYQPLEFVDNNTTSVPNSTHIEQQINSNTNSDENRSNNPAYVEVEIDVDVEVNNIEITSTSCIEKIIEKICTLFICIDFESPLIDKFQYLTFTDKIINFFCCCTLSISREPLNLLFRQLFLVWCFIDNEGFVSWCFNRDNSEFDEYGDGINFEPLGITDNMCDYNFYACRNIEITDDMYDFNFYACGKSFLLTVSIVPITIATFFIRFMFALLSIFIMLLLFIGFVLIVIVCTPFVFLLKIRKDVMESCQDF